MKTNPTGREIALIEEFLTNLDEELEGNIHELNLKEFKYKSQIKKYEEKVDNLRSLISELAGLTAALKTLTKKTDKFAAMEDLVAKQKYKKDVFSTRLESDFYRCELSLPLDLAILKAIHETMVRFAKDWRDILAKANPESKEPIT